MMKKPITMKMPKALGDPRYRGKNLLLVKGKVVVAGSWKQVSAKLDQVYKEGNIPTVAYIPKADTLILLGN